jgi:hypothetical protein
MNVGNWNEAALRYFWEYINCIFGTVRLPIWIRINGFYCHANVSEVERRTAWVACTAATDRSSSRESLWTTFLLSRRSFR